VLLGGAGVASEALDRVFAITLLTMSAAYLYFAMRAVYAGVSRFDLQDDPTDRSDGCHRTGLSLLFALISLHGP